MVLSTSGIGTTRRRGGAGELQDVALCVASADAVRDRRQRAQQRLGAAEVAAAVGRERAAGWMPDEACHVEVGAERTREPPLLRSQKALGEIEALRARKRHHRVQVV